MTNQDRPVDLLADFDTIAAFQPDTLTRQLIDAGLPGVVVDDAQRDLSIALAGMRLAIRQWIPRPPLTTSDSDAAEVSKLRAVLEDMLVSETGRVAETFIRPFREASQRTRKTLVDWNSRRKVQKVFPTNEQHAIAADRLPPRTEPLEVETLPGGGFTILDYGIPPRE